LDADRAPQLKASVRRLPVSIRFMSSAVALKSFLVTLLVFWGQIVFAQNHSVSQWCGAPSSVELAPYKPQAISALTALPSSIRFRVEEHLTARLGHDFYSKLIFATGAIIDLNEFLRMKPNTKWKVHSYELAFKYSDPKNGLKEYCSRILLDSAGQVMREIDLPEVGRYPRKATIISVDRAFEIARARGFKPKKMSVAIGYDEDVGSLVWEIDSFAFSDQYSITTKILRIDAHTGEILKEGFSSGIK
jgi:hypothetical protein